MKKIALGTDHAGYKMKEVIKAHLSHSGYVVVDFGVVFGGSGNGEVMVANKVAGLRCGVCWNVESARLTKEHNNANMIAIGGRMVSEKEGVEIVKAWLNAEFSGGRHQERIEKIE